jgi:hypothetical protein
VKAVHAYVLIGCLTWVCVVGWQVADDQARFATLHECRYSIAFAVVWGAWASVVWPVGLPFVLHVTGFAAHGWGPPQGWSTCWSEIGSH